MTISTFMGLPSRMMSRGSLSSLKQRSMSSFMLIFWPSSSIMAEPVHIVAVHLHQDVPVPESAVRGRAFENLADQDALFVIRSPNALPLGGASVGGRLMPMST